MMWKLMRQGTQHLVGFVRGSRAEAVAAAQRLSDRTGQRLRMIENPQAIPKVGEIWLGVKGDRCRILAVSGRRITVLQLDSGHRVSSDLADFLSTYRAPPVARRNANPRGRLPFNVEVTEALGGGWMVLVNGFQWGRGEPDRSGAYDEVFSTKAKAIAAYLEAHPKSNPGGRNNPRVKLRDDGGSVVTMTASDIWRLTSRWPASGLTGAKRIVFTFDASGDLVGVSAAAGVLERAEGSGALEALAQDAKDSAARVRRGLPARYRRSNPKGRKAVRPPWRDRFEAMVGEAADLWVSKANRLAMMGLPPSLYLYYRPSAGTEDGALYWATQDENTEGLTLAWNQRIGDQWSNKATIAREIHKIVGRLPIIAPEGNPRRRANPGGRITSLQVWELMPDADRPARGTKGFDLLQTVAAHVQSGDRWNDRVWIPASYNTSAYHSLYARVKRALGTASNPRGGPRIVYNKLLGGWYVVTGPHQTPLNGRFNSKAEAQAWLAGDTRRNPSRSKSARARRKRGRLVTADLSRRTKRAGVRYQRRDIPAAQLAYYAHQGAGRLVRRGFHGPSPNPGGRMTEAIARAAAADAGNRSAAKAGRKKWSRTDYNASVREFNRLWPAPIFDATPNPGGRNAWGTPEQAAAVDRLRRYADEYGLVGRGAGFQGSAVYVDFRDPKKRASERGAALRALIFANGVVQGPQRLVEANSLMIERDAEGPRTNPGGHSADNLPGSAIDLQAAGYIPCPFCGGAGITTPGLNVGPQCPVCKGHGWIKAPKGAEFAERARRARLGSREPNPKGRKLTGSAIEGPLEAWPGGMRASGQGWPTEAAARKALAQVQRYDERAVDVGQRFGWWKILYLKGNPKGRKPPQKWEWVIGEGRPSWHQQRAGGTAAAFITGFANREEAEAHAAMIRANFPDRHLVVMQRPKPAPRTNPKGRKLGVPGTVGNFLAVLSSKVTQQDQRDAKRVRGYSHHALAHMLGAVGRVRAAVAGLEASSDPTALQRLLAAAQDEFVPGFPPLRALEKQIADYTQRGILPSLVRGGPGPQGNPRPKRRRKRPVHAAGVRGKGYRNPRESEVVRARRTFRRLNEIEPGRVSRVSGARNAPKVAVKLGELVSFTYRSDKYAGTPENPSGKAQLYEHRTKRPRPVLATDPDGREVHIVGGRMHPTPDGLVN